MKKNVRFGARRRNRGTQDEQKKQRKKARNHFPEPKNQSKKNTYYDIILSDNSNSKLYCIHMY